MQQEKLIRKKIDRDWNGGGVMASPLLFSDTRHASYPDDCRMNAERICHPQRVKALLWQVFLPYSTNILASIALLYGAVQYKEYIPADCYAGIVTGCGLQLVKNLPRMYEDCKVCKGLFRNLFL